jgi:methylmalonyl-CoA mutase C-terminal domain/subunit
LSQPWLCSRRSSGIVRAAIDEDVDVIGLSVLTGGYEPIAKDVLDALKAQSADIAVVVGGVVRKPDIPRLIEMGVAAVFPTGSRFDDILTWFRERDAARAGS